jgi:hypothetical protein
VKIKTLEAGRGQLEAQLAIRSFGWIGDDRRIGIR